MEDEWITAKQAAVMFSKKEETLRTYGKRKLIETKKEGERLLFSISSIKQFLGEMVPHGHGENGNHNNGERVGNLVLISEAEARKALKYEQYREKKRLNDIAEGHLVHSATVQRDFEEIFTSFFDLCREFVDKTAIELNLSPSKAKEMHLNFNRIWQAKKDDLARRLKAHAKSSI